MADSNHEQFTWFQNKLADSHFTGRDIGTWSGKFAAKKQGRNLRQEIRPQIVKSVPRLPLPVMAKVADEIF